MEWHINCNQNSSHNKLKTNFRERVFNSKCISKYEVQIFTKLIWIHKNYSTQKAIPECLLLNKHNDKFVIKNFGSDKQMVSLKVKTNIIDC